MKYLSLELTNYANIYNGLKLNHIFIDISKAKHSLIIIIGPNGSGKTSLMDALSVLPDENNKFIPKKEAIKIVRLQDDDIIYEVKCVHGWKNGARETGKAYLKKILIDGTEIDLNPNGNIRSYKEKIYEELDLDPNFLVLSHLSSVQNGLGKMTTSERKALVNNIVKEVAVYNDMYKVFSKRSNSFKSIRNNIINKISSIGDPDGLKASYKSITNRINTMMNDKDELIENIASAKSKISILDPTGSIQDSYNNIYNSLNEITTKCTGINNDILKLLKSDCINKDSIDDEELFKMINDTKEEINQLNIKIEVTKSKKDDLYTKQDLLSKQIQDKIARLESLELDMGKDNIDLLISNEKEKNNKYKEILQSINMVDSKLTKDEFISGIDVLRKIKDQIYVFKSDSYYDLIEKSANLILENKSPLSSDYYINELYTVKQQLSDIEKDINTYYLLEKQSSILKDRPVDCSISSCAFIKDALKAKEEMNSYNIVSLNKQATELNNQILLLEKDMEENKELIKFTNAFKNILRDISAYALILKKFPIDTSIFLDKNKLVNLIINDYNFPEIDLLYSNIQNADIIDLYKDSNDILKNLYNRKEMNRGKIDEINELHKQIDSLTEEIKIITDSIEDANSYIKENETKIEMNNQTQLILDKIFMLKNELTSLKNEKAKLLSSFNNIKSNMISIKESLNSITTLSNKLDLINKQLGPVMEDRNKINYGLKQLEELNVELDEFNNKYEKVETFKRYTSPTKDGIQNIFIELYMNTTLKICNDMLGLLFGGEFILEQFIINDKEFRIPVIGSGLPHDDISSMSNAQVSMIQMIISFAILYQSSTRYNIVQLDEIDSMLDTVNRLEFLSTLERLMQILKIEQAFMISHNAENNLEEASIISLHSTLETNDKYDYIYRYDSTVL